MMTSANEDIFRVTGLLWRESTGHRWIPITKVSDVEFDALFIYAPEQMVKQTIKTLVIWDAWRPLWRNCNDELIETVFEYNIIPVSFETGVTYPLSYINSIFPLSMITQDQSNQSARQSVNLAYVYTYCYHCVLWDVQQVQTLTLCFVTAGVNLVALWKTIHRIRRFPAIFLFANLLDFRQHGIHLCFIGATADQILGYH